jgi:hypothetical protein
MLFENTTILSVTQHVKKLSLSAVFCIAFAVQAQAGTISLIANGEWNEFNVDDFSATSQGLEWVDLNDSNSPNFGSALNYQFTINNGFKGFLSVVDAGLAGDQFQVFNNGQSIGLTSSTTNMSDYSNNFSDNLANVNFSSGVFLLTEGTYNITGALFSSLQPFNATNGALKLDITPVPLPGAYGLFLGGISFLAFMRRRNTRNTQV